MDFINSLLKIPEINVDYYTNLSYESLNKPLADSHKKSLIDTEKLD